MTSIAPSVTAPPAQIGTRYTVLEQLGRGGMAIVYRARDAVSDTEVALKQLNVVKEVDRRRKLNALFEREFYVLSQLAHPSISRNS
jgi:eukaryotic-like serine/threonine-protein kinase